VRSWCCRVTSGSRQRRQLLTYDKIAYIGSRITTAEDEKRAITSIRVAQAHYADSLMRCDRPPNACVFNGAVGATPAKCDEIQCRERCEITIANRDFAAPPTAGRRYSGKHPHDAPNTGWRHARRGHAMAAMYKFEQPRLSMEPQPIEAALLAPRRHFIVEGRKGNDLEQSPHQRP